MIKTLQNTKTIKKSCFYRLNALEGMRGDRSHWMASSNGQDLLGAIVEWAKENYIKVVDRAEIDGRERMGKSKIENR